MIKVLIAEDQVMLRDALATLLALENDIEIVGAAATGDEALRQVRADAPDVLLSDIEMPGMTGLELAATIRREPIRTRVLIVTTFDRPGYLRRALDAGVAGYVLKDTPSQELAQAIRRVVAGEQVIQDGLIREAWGEADPLNDTERRLLRLAETGLDSIQIAEASGLARGTVRNYLHKASSKLGASNRVEAARLARQNGWL